MTASYCGGCEGGSESRGNSHSRRSLSGTEEDGETGGSDFAVERDETETEHDRWERVCREKLHLTPCDPTQYLELLHRAENRFNLVDCVI